MDDRRAAAEEEAGAVGPADDSGAGRTFAALRFRNYRLLWAGNLISNSGDWMDQIALNWLVVQTTDSPVYLGLVNLGRGAPILLFTLLAGVAADRIERRLLMVATQAFAMVLAVVLAVLVVLDHASIWLILAIATGRGVVQAFNLPTRQALISDLVPRAQLANAIALYSTTLNLTKIIGPLLAGIVISTLGLAACFIANALSFVIVLRMLLAMQVPPSRRPVPTGSVVANIAQGITFIWQNKTIRILVLVALVPMFLGQPYITLLALFAADVFALDAGGLGWLTASAALGSVIGSLALAHFGTSSRRGVTMLVFLFLFGGLLVAFSLNTWLPMAPVLLLGIGAMQTAYNASNSTILQMVVPDHLRGRVLSALYLNKGLAQLGTAFLATLAAWLGVRYALASTAAIVVLFALALLGSPAMRRLNPT